jgi:hypothetical protein
MAYPPTPPVARTDSTLVQTNHANDHNLLGQNITDIVTILGTAPNGPGYATVSARMAAPYRSYVTSLYQAGPFAVGTTLTFNVPWKADLVIVSTITSWVNTAGMGGCIIYMDGSPLAYYADMYFNTTGVHATTATTNIMRAVAAGNHTISAALTSGNGACDANDRAHHAITMVEVS